MRIASPINSQAIVIRSHVGCNKFAPAPLMDGLANGSWQMRSFNSCVCMCASLMKVLIVEELGRMGGRKVERKCRVCMYA